MVTYTTNGPNSSQGDLPVSLEVKIQNSSAKWGVYYLDFSINLSMSIMYVNMQNHLPKKWGHCDKWNPKGSERGHGRDVCGGAVHIKNSVTNGISFTTHLVLPLRWRSRQTSRMPPAPVALSPRRSPRSSSHRGRLPRRTWWKTPSALIDTK